MPNDHGLSPSTAEQRARDADTTLDFLASGGRPPLPSSSLTLAAFATQGYVTNGVELVYVDQPAVAVTFPAVDGIHWLALDHSTFEAVTGWTRPTFGAHYIIQQNAANPGSPAGALLCAEVLIAGSIITSVDYLAASTATLLVNVQNFGADPTGATDSTVAFQAAADALSRLAAFQPGGVTTSNISTQFEYVIPPGRYTLNTVVTFDGTQLTIRGNGAIIEQTVVGNNIFEVQNAFMVNIDEVRFASGNTQLFIWNNNLDSAMWNIEGCVFQDAGDWAIDTQPVSGTNPLSTLCVIRDSRFIANARVLRAWNDHCQVKDCWVFLRAGQTLSNTAAFENRGFLHLNNMFGVPPDKAVGPLTNVRWVDNYNTLIVDRSRFGGEFGGITPVWNFSHYEIPEPANFLGPRVIIENSDVFDNTPGQGIITIKQDVDTHPGVPAHVRMKGNFGPTDQPWIANPDALDLTAYLAGILDTETKFEYDIDINMDRAVGTIPQDLRKFLVYERSIWLPNFTFTTPGDLNAPLVTQIGHYTKYANVVHLRGTLTTSTFTHTTASGGLFITNLPFVVKADATIISLGSLSWGGITKAGFTDIAVQSLNNTSTLRVIASGSGVAPTPVDAADMPTGGTVFLEFALTMQIY
jgi:hypothetical protein